MTRYESVDQLPPAWRDQVLARDRADKAAGRGSATEPRRRPAKPKAKAPAVPREPLPDWLWCGHGGCDLQAGCTVPGRQWRLTAWERPYPTNKFDSGTRQEIIAAKTRWFNIGVRLGHTRQVPRLRRFYTFVQPIYVNPKREPVDVDGVALCMKHVVDGMATRWDRDTGVLTSAGVFPDDKAAIWEDGQWTERGWWAGNTERPARFDTAARSDRLEITILTLRPDQEFPWT